MKFVNRVIKKMSWYDNLWCGATKLWAIKDFDLDVINLGSNSGRYAFDYEKSNIKGSNWALSPQSLVYDFNILKNYFSYLKDEATILIPLCPFSCLITKNTKEKNLKYYTILHPATIIDYDDNERIRALKLKSNIIKNSPYFVLQNICKQPLRYIHKCIQSNKVCNYTENAKYYIKIWEREFKFSFTDGYMPDQHKLAKKNRTEDLTNMIDFCLERGFKPVLIIPPMHKELHSRLTSQIKEDYIYSFVQDVNKYNIPFLDYSCDYTYNDSDFSDSLCMNKQGARKFTNRVLQDLKLL